MFSRANNNLDRAAPAVLAGEEASVASAVVGILEA
jgi:hypothetical protein